MKVQDIKDLISLGHFAYGSSIDVKDFGLLNSIRYPNIHGKTAMEAVSLFREYDLKILGFYNQVNNHLLSIGRKIYKNKEQYEIATVVDTLSWVDQYREESYAKQKKADKLNKSFIAVHPSIMVPSSKKARSHIAKASSSRLAEIPQ